MVTIRAGLNMNFEFKSAHEFFINLTLKLNSTFAKSINMNLFFSKSMNIVFLKSMNLDLNLKI